jgi:hypothetical protein
MEVSETPDIQLLFSWTSPPNDCAASPCDTAATTSLLSPVLFNSEENFLFTSIHSLIYIETRNEHAFRMINKDEERKFPPSKNPEYTRQDNTLHGKC